MTDFTVRNLKQLDASTSAPDGLEARVGREALETEHLGVSYFRFAPGMRSPFGHSHGEQEEAYVVVSGSGRVRLDEEVVELGRWDVVRIGPGVMRALEGGPDGLELIAIGSDQRDGEEIDSVEGFWER